jgi:hypothetical protein
VTLHVFYLPKRQRNSGGKEVSKTRSQTAQLETNPVAIERNRAIKILNQKTYVTDRGPRYQISHESA